MSKPGGVGSGGLIRPQVPNLQQKEATQVQKQQTQKAANANDAQRLAQQAGFHRYNKTGRRAFDIGDSSKAPIPMPEDDVDADAWSQEGLEKAQENLSLVGSQLEEVVKQAASGETTMAEGLAASSFLPTEGGVRQLQDLADRPAPVPIAMDEVSNSVRQLFNLELEDTVPMGQRLLATGLVVAGRAEAIEKEGTGLNERTLAKGVQEVTTSGNGAVRSAKEMSSGVNREVAFNRTFVFKR